MCFLEIVRFLLELSEGVNTTFLETEFASTDETFRAVPVVSRSWGRIDAIAMEGIVAAIAEE